MYESLSQFIPWPPLLFLQKVAYDAPANLRKHWQIDMSIDQCVYFLNMQLKTDASSVKSAEWWKDLFTRLTMRTLGILSICNFIFQHLF